MGRGTGDKPRTAKLLLKWKAFLIINFERSQYLNLWCYRRDFSEQKVCSKGFASSAPACHAARSEFPLDLSRSFWNSSSRRRNLVPYSESFQRSESSLFVFLGSAFCLTWSGRALSAPRSNSSTLCHRYFSCFEQMKMMLSFKCLVPKAVIILNRFSMLLLKTLKWEKLEHRSLGHFGAA